VPAPNDPALHTPAQLQLPFNIRRATRSGVQAPLRNCSCPSKYPKGNSLRGAGPPAQLQLPFKISEGQLAPGCRPPCAIAVALQYPKGNSARGAGPPSQLQLPFNIRRATRPGVQAPLRNSLPPKNRMVIAPPLRKHVASKERKRHTPQGRRGAGPPDRPKKK
jgi:hypothetical protein